MSKLSWLLNQGFFNFYQKYHDSKRLVQFFYITLNQSASKKILNLMKRGYTKKEIEGLFSALFENQLPILLEESKKLTAGKIIAVKISQRKNNQLLGKVL